MKIDTQKFDAYFKCNLKEFKLDGARWKIE